MSLLLAAKKKRPGEEAAGPSATPAPVVAPVVPVVSEDFVGAAATGVAYEDALPALVFAAALVTLPNIVEEEFGGAHPYEDGVAAQVPVVVAPLVAAPVDEVIAPSGAGLDEQVAQATVTVVAPVVTTPVDEDFIGKLTVEEHGVAPWTPTTPVWISAVIDEEFVPPVVAALGEDTAWTWVAPPLVWLGAVNADEEFGGAHPYEDAAPWVVAAASVWIGPASLDEDFPSYRMIEEPAFQAWFPPEPVRITVPPPEDFAGVLTVEPEEPAWSWIAPPPAVTATPSFDEEFGLPHPSEEAGPSWMPSGLPIWISNVVSEEFAGSLPLDEQAAPVATILAPSWLALDNREEEFGLPHPIEEAWWSLPPIAPVWISAPSLDEEFAGSLPIDEAPVEGVDLVPLFTRLAFVDPSVASEEFAGLHVDEEPGALAAVAAPLAATIYVDFGEEFAGSLPLEEVAGAVALHWQATPTQLTRDESVGEVFPGAMVDEEPGAVFLWPPPVFIAPADVGEEFVRRVVPPPPPPIPPPPPPRPIIPSIGGTGGFVAAPYRPMPPCPPGTEWVYDPAKKTMVCRRLEPARVEQQTDYAILPLEGEVVVKALANGVVDTFIDSKGRTVTRLTSDDGTVYYYANVRGARSGRVTKDQPIGVSKTDERESKLLTAGGATAAPSDEPGTYGVLPIAKRVPQPPRPWHPTLYMRPMPPVVIEPQPRAIERQNIVRLVFLGLGVVGVVGFVWWLVSRPKIRRRSRR